MDEDCQAVQQSDSMVCKKCNITWDVNDPLPPQCKNVVAYIHPLDLGRVCEVSPHQESDEQIPLYTAPPDYDAGFAAGMMKAVEILRERISPNDAMDEAEERLYDTLEKSAQLIEEAIPTDSKAALREVVEKAVYAGADNIEGHDLTNSEPWDDVINSVLEGKS